jgi:cysteine desulfurase
MGKALELAEEYLRNGVESTKRLRDRLESAILSRIPNASLNGLPELRTPNTTNISFENVEGEAILLLLDEARICASSGAACATGALEASHVLKAMGVAPERTRGSVRFSLSRYTTLEEIERVLDELPPIVFRLSRLSTTS